MKRVTIRPSAAWYTDEIKEQKTIRRRFERKWRHSGCQNDLKSFKDQCQLVKDLLTSSKRNYYSSLIKESEGDQKSLFGHIDRLLHRIPPKQYPTGYSDIDLANKFANFFMDKVRSIRDNLPFLEESCADPAGVSICTHNNELCDFKTVTTVEVRRKIGKLAGKSCVLDPLPALLQKNLLDELLPVLTQIVNLSLTSACVPSELKIAALQPLLKKASLDCELFPNFRPVSNLKFVSKVIEKEVASQLTEYLERTNQAVVFQSAYKKHHSTETALVRVQNDILCAIDNNKAVVLLLLDLSAAFDTVDHGILISRLSNRFGIKGSVLDWFRSYLHDRKQFVSINGHNSSLHTLHYGVPQGSVLGPLLYLLYTSPLADILEKHEMSYHLYADDCQIYTTFTFSSHTEMEIIKTRMMDCTKDIDRWMTMNKLKLNKDKSELIVFSSRYRQQILFNSLQVGGQDFVTCSEFVRNIGITFDRTLTMSKHINVMCKSVYYHLRNINRIRTHLTHNTAAILVHALVSSKLDHGNSLLYGLPKYQLSKLQSVQNAAARVVSFTGKYDHITPVLLELHWLPIEHRITYKILLLTYKALNGLAPSYLTDLLHVYEPTRQLRSSNQYNLKKPKYKLKTYGYRAFSVAAPSLWNELPVNLKNLNTVEQFKAGLKTLLFKQAFNL